MSFKETEVDLRHLIAVQTAIEFCVIDILSRLYLLAPDPDQESANHRARMRAELSTEGRIPPLRPAAEITARSIADAVDALLESAGRAASMIAEQDGR
jgi:hypothetical protein